MKLAPGKEKSPTSGDRREAAAWLVVERKENWDNDQQRGFALMGFPEKYQRRVASFREGDLLFIYVASGHSCIADVRAVVEVEPKKQWSLEWDDIFPVRVKTRSVVALKEGRWVNIRPLIDRLEISRGRGDWRQCFRHALRRLSAADAQVLLAECKNAARETQPQPAPPTRGARPSRLART